MHSTHSRRSSSSRSDLASDLLVIMGAGPVWKVAKAFRSKVICD
jgi:hypothetical protein